MQSSVRSGIVLRTVVMAVFASAGAVPFAAAQAENSGPQTVVLSATVPESLTLSLSASALSFSLNAGSAANPASTGITANTAWVLKPGRTVIALYAYFNSSAAALTDGAGNAIPSSAFTISDNAGAFTALTNTVAFGAANAGMQLASFVITGANRSGNRTDVLAFNIDLSSGTLPQLPAAVYTGTLNIQAQAAP
jgi:hypothetical protein